MLLESGFHHSVHRTIRDAVCESVARKTIGDDEEYDAAADPGDLKAEEHIEEEHKSNKKRPRECEESMSERAKRCAESFEGERLIHTGGAGHGHGGPGL